MIDHVGFPVSDYERAKAFYLKALAPLDYVLVMEVTKEQTGREPAAGFGANGKADFWIGGEGGMNRPLHVAILAKDRATVDAFYEAALAAGGRDNGAPGIRAHYHPNYYGPSCSIPTATTSRRCAARRHDRVPSVSSFRGTSQHPCRYGGCRLTHPKSRPQHRDTRPSRRARTRQAIRVRKCRRRRESPANRRCRRNCRATAG
jgi:Lactoylglutathione lyase and related lyases